MGLRENLNDNKLLGVGLAVGVLIVAGVIFAIRSSDESPDYPIPTQLWYYDLETRRLFADAIDRIPPFTNRDGHESVLATVMSCSSPCGDKDLEGKTPAEVEQMGLVVGYLQRLTPSAQQSVEQYKKTSDKPEHVMLHVMQRMIYEGEFREVKSDSWQPMRSRQFVRLGEALEQRCPGSEQCKPAP